MLQCHLGFDFRIRVNRFWVKMEIGVVDCLAAVLEELDNVLCRLLEALTGCNEYGHFFPTT